MQSEKADKATAKANSVTKSTVKVGMGLNGLFEVNHDVCRHRLNFISLSPGVQKPQ